MKKKKTTVGKEKRNEKKVFLLKVNGVQRTLLNSRCRSGSGFGVRGVCKAKVSELCLESDNLALNLFIHGVAGSQQLFKGDVPQGHTLDSNQILFDLPHILINLLEDAKLLAAMKNHRGRLLEARAKISAVLLKNKSLGLELSESVSSAAGKQSHDCGGGLGLVCESRRRNRKKLEKSNGRFLSKKNK